MVPITTLRVVPIQRYRHIISHYRHMILLVRPTGSPAYSCLRCISFDSYIKPQLHPRLHPEWRRCISFDSYIKPQLTCPLLCGSWVVYLLIPTSNHNHGGRFLKNFMLYIFWFLHQTTTLYDVSSTGGCCISFDSYIKPQPLIPCCHKVFRCISFDSYIKPQLWTFIFDFEKVVYLLIPTSNHN